MALHRTGKTLTDGCARHVDVLTREVVIRDDFLTDVQHRVRIHAELSDLALGFHGSSGKMTAHRLARPLGLGRTGTELDGGIAVALSSPLGHDLQLVELENGYGNLAPVFHEQPGHPDLFCNNA